MTPNIKPVAENESLRRSNLNTLSETLSLVCFDVTPALQVERSFAQLKSREITPNIH